MSKPTFCIYTISEPHLLLYNYKIESRCLEDIDKVLNSSKWTTFTDSSVQIEYNQEIQLLIQKKENYIIVIVFENKYRSKISMLMYSIINFIEEKKISNFNGYSRNFDEMIILFDNQENKIDKIQNQIKDVTDTMSNVIAKTIERGDKVIDLEQKTNDLMRDADMFASKSTSLKRKMQWKNIKIYVGAGIIITLLLVIIGLLATQ